MTMRVTAISGILVGIVFFVGFLVLFKVNPQTYDELNNLSLASYNLVGMNGRGWMNVAYIGAGLLNFIFCIGILGEKPNSVVTVIGTVFLMICSLIWLSFGLFPLNLSGNISLHSMLIRLLVFITVSIGGLSLVAIDHSRIIQDKFLKYYTYATTGAIMILSFLNVFVFNDETWIRSNVSLAIYFSWPMVFGLRTLNR